MPQMNPSEKGDEIDVDEEPRQGSSSRSSPTAFAVTLEAPERMGRMGTPFRVLRLDLTEVNPCLASEEMTFPTVLFSTTAISLAAVKTSSSIAKVIRTSCP